MRTSWLVISVILPMVFTAYVHPETVGAQPEEQAYAGIGEALHEGAGEPQGWLSDQATLYLLKSLGLDWKFTRKPGHTSWEDVRVHGSDNGLYFILVGARAGEFGQHGPARYCLIDSSGTKYWQRQGRIDAPPLVSNQGTVALRYGDGSEGDRRDWATLRIDFIGLKGDSTGSVFWDDRIRRPLQRYFVQEQASFTSDGNLFITTMNLIAGLVGEETGEEADETNNTFVFALRPDGTIAWEHYLGAFWPRAMTFQDEPCCVRLEGEWTAKFLVAGSFDEGYVVIGPEGGLVEKVVTRHVDLGDAPE
jgi:hypothetical protein